MKVSLFVSVLCIVLGIVAFAQDVSVVPMHSFRPPYSTGRAGIRWWNYGGDVTVFQNYLRLTQDSQSQIGYIWNKNPVSLKDWEVTLSVKIDGKGRLGGDGIAFWYVAQPNTEGKAFGSAERWKGLGVFIDTFDNDNKHDNPYISVIVNDGSLEYNPETDGKDIQLGGCRASMRKTSEDAKLVISYRGTTKELKVSYNLGGSSDHECYSGTVDLPTGYYLGVSAATGGVSDNQDVNFFEFRRIFDDSSRGIPGIPESPSIKDIYIKEQEKKNEKDMDSLKQDVDALKKMNVKSHVRDIPAGDVAGRISYLEEQLKKMDDKLSTITKVAEGVQAISSTMDQLKSRVETLEANNKNKPASTMTSDKLRSELSKQLQELSRIATGAQENVNSAVNDRLGSFENTVKSVQQRIDELALESKKNGGSTMNVILIVVMVAESCLLLFMFMKGRQASNKYDKMW